MIGAYKEGIPDNGKSFPEGVKIVKIEWIKKKNPESPYFVEIPDTALSTGNSPNSLSSASCSTNTSTHSIRELWALRSPQ